MSRTAVIIQARMASTRLPGKVLLDLGGRSILHWVVSRCQAIKSADVVCCATSEDRSCDPIESEARRLGAVVFRGSETDVLQRYAEAARMLKADVILRVTSDCPLIDPEICDAVLRFRLQQDAEYACNNMPPSFPHGLDCEAFTYQLLDRADRHADTLHEREHVTPWMRNSAGASRANLQCPDADYLDQRWTLDYPEDLAFLRGLYRCAPQLESANMGRVLRVVAKHPDLLEMNRLHHNVGRPPHNLPPQGQSHEQ